MEKKVKSEKTIPLVLSAFFSKMGIIVKKIDEINKN
jgi:hypothetical protein